MTSIARILDFGFWILACASGVSRVCHGIQNQKSKIQNTLRDHITRLVILCAFGIGATPSAYGTEAERAASVDFQKANALYQRGQFGDAVDGYRTIIGQGLASGPLYYNLGNAWLKRGRMGEAIWAYERARALMPRDPDVRANLAYARSRVPESLSVSWSLPRWWQWATLGDVFRPGELACALIILVWICVGCRLALMWGPGLAAALRPIAWGLIVLMTGAGVVLLAQTMSDRLMPTVIVVEERAEVTFAPQPGSTRHFLLPEGTRVRVLQREPGWLRVQRGDGRLGWVQSTAVAQ